MTDFSLLNNYLHNLTMLVWFWPSQFRSYRILNVLRYLCNIHQNVMTEEDSRKNCNTDVVIELFLWDYTLRHITRGHGGAVFDGRFPAQSPIRRLTRQWTVVREGDKWSARNGTSKKKKRERRIVAWRKLSLQKI